MSIFSSFLLLFYVCLCDCVGVVTTVAGGGATSLPGYVNGVGTVTRFYYPYGVAVTTSGDFIVADSMNCVIRKITSSGSPDMRKI